MTKLMTKRFLKNPLALLALMVLLLLLAAGIFFLIGTRATHVANKELPKLNPSSPSPSPGAKFSFAKLAARNASTLSSTKLSGSKRVICRK